jgi:RNA polymerase sigma factor (sigma-70 family)
MAKPLALEPTALGAFTTPALGLSGGFPLLRLAEHRKASSNGGGMTCISSIDSFSAPDVAAASLELIVTAIIGRGFPQMAERTAPERSKTGEALFLAHFDVVERAIDFVCSRNHLSSTDADDFSSYVTLRIVEDDYEVFARFQGRASLRTYLTVVIQRMLLDYRVRIWGRWRPSAEAKRCGPLAIRLEELLVRDGYPFEEAYEMLKTNHGLTVTREELERLAARLPPRAPRRFESEDALATVAAEDASADELVKERDRQDLAARVSRALRSVMSGLDQEDQLILLLRFEDGRTVAEIAATLRLDQKALYRRVNDLLKKLRKGLESEGIDAAAVQEILDSPGVTLDWARTAPGENTMKRPSMTAAPRPAAGQGGTGATGWR